MSKPVYILGIESSCDDTSASVICDAKVLSNVVANQEVHAKYGGVVPELASRKHLESLLPVLKTCFEKAGLNYSDVDAIAGPDNVSYIGFDTLIITEDTSDHDNNFTWSYNLETGDLTRILSAPTGAENTGPYMFNDINGFSYLTNVSQHPFGIAADPAEGEEAELGYFIFPVNGAE